MSIYHNPATSENHDSRPMIGFLRNVTLRQKITISFVLIVLCGTAVSTFIGSRIITQAMRNEALKQVRHGLEAARIVYDHRLDDVRHSLVIITETRSLTNALEEDLPGRLPDVLARLRRENGLDFLTLVDERRGFIIRGSGGIPTRFPPGGYATPAFLAGSFDGAVRAGTLVMSRAELVDEDPALAERAHFHIVPIPMTSPDGRTESDSGLVLLASAPIAAGPGVRGILYGGVLLNRNDAMVDQINRLISGGEQSDGKDVGSVSIFLNDVRVATTVLREPGVRAEGTRVSSDVSAAVLSQGQFWYGRAYVVNEWHLTAYQPLRDRTGRIIGILYVGMQEKPFLEVRTAMMLTFLIIAVVGVLIVLGLTYLITRSMIHPLEDIVKASNIIAAGNLDHTVEVHSRDEIGHLAGSFNKMVASLKSMKLELEEWGRTLEEKVRKRTEELVAVREQMSQSEKLASLGRLAAGVAHEINNPLGGILAFSSLALEECGDKHPLRKNLDIIVKQTLRCRETVKGLLDFARQSTDQATITEINGVIEKTLVLLQNQSMFQNIKTVTNLAPGLPNVLIDPGHLQEVIVNIALNAVDAMEEVGTLTVETLLDSKSRQVLIRISDTGKGIPDDILPLIFEPFFTTKKVGKGTGLGLSIVHGIVTRANGKVEVTNSPTGATFTVHLPVAQAPPPVSEKSDEKKNAGNRVGQSAQR